VTEYPDGHIAVIVEKLPPAGTVVPAGIVTTCVAVTNVAASAWPAEVAANASPSPPHTIFAQAFLIIALLSLNVNATRHFHPFAAGKFPLPRGGFTTGRFVFAQRLDRSDGRRETVREHAHVRQCGWMAYFVGEAIAADVCNTGHSKSSAQ
jgi:hypothetical protein